MPAQLNANLIKCLRWPEFKQNFVKGVKAMKAAPQDVGSNGFALEKQHGEFGASRRQVKRWMKKRLKWHMACEDLVDAAVYKGGFCGSRMYLMDIALEVIMGI